MVNLMFHVRGNDLFTYDGLPAYFRLLHYGARAIAGLPVKFGDIDGSWILTVCDFV